MAYCQDPRNVNKADNNDTETDAQPDTEGELGNTASAPSSPETSVLRNDAKHLRETQSCRDLRNFKCPSITDEELTNFEVLLPSHLKGGVNHILILHSEEDKKKAIQFKENLINEVKIKIDHKLRKVNVKLLDEHVASDLSTQLDFAYERSVLILIFATDELCDDNSLRSKGYTCYLECTDDEKSLFVIHTAPKANRNYKLPMELKRNVHAINYWPETASDCYRAIQNHLQSRLDIIIKQEHDLYKKKKRYCEEHYEDLKRLEHFKSSSLPSIAHGSSDSTEASSSGGQHQETNRKETDFRPDDGIVGFAFQQQSSCPENIPRKSYYASKPNLQSNKLSDFDRIYELVSQLDKSPDSKIEPLLSESSETQHIPGMPLRSRMQQHDCPQQQCHRLEELKKALQACQTSLSPEAIFKTNSAGLSSKTWDGPLTAGITKQQYGCPQQQRQQLEEEVKKALHACKTTSSPEAISKMYSAGPNSKTGDGPLTAGTTKQQHDCPRQPQHQLEEEWKKMLHAYMTSSSPEAISKMNSAKPSSKTGDGPLTADTPKRGRKDGDMSLNVVNRTKPRRKAEDSFPSAGNSHFSSRTEYGPSFHNHTTTNSNTTHNTKTNKVKMAKATNVFVNCTVNQYCDKDNNEEDENDDEDDDKDNSEEDDTSNIF